MPEHDWNFPFEGPLHDVFPALHDAQSAWLSQIDSLHAPDRKTHELIRMVVTVMLRNPDGVRRHAALTPRHSAGIGGGLPTGVEIRESEPAARTTSRRCAE